MSSKRRRPPRRLFRERRTNYRQQFQAAMLGEHIREGLPAPCLVCSQPNAEHHAFWTPAREFAAKLGVPEGRTKTFIYKLCRKCAEKADRGDRWTQQFIEAAIVALYRGEEMVCLGADGMPIVDP